MTKISPFAYTFNMQELKHKFITPQILQEHVNAIESIYKEGLDQFLEGVSKILLEKNVIIDIKDFKIQQCKKNINDTIDMQMDCLDHVFRDAYQTSPLENIKKQMMRKEEGMHNTIDAIKNHALRISNSLKNESFKQFKEQQNKKLESMRIKPIQFDEELPRKTQLMLNTYAQKIDRHYQAAMSEVQKWNLIPEIMKSARQNSIQLKKYKSKSKRPIRTIK